MIAEERHPPHPKFSHTPLPHRSAQPVQPTTEALDALTDLFLGGGGSVPAGTRVDQNPVIASIPQVLAPTHPAPTPVPPRRPTVEVALVGHLPTLASAWAGHYARMRQRETGENIVLIRQGGQRLFAETFGYPGFNQHHTRLSAHADLRDMLADSVADAGRMLVWSTSADALVGGEQLLQADEITLLTSGDEAGVVAAYQLIKRLTLARSGSSTNPRADSLCVRLVVLGCAENRAQAVWRKLKDASESFLAAQLTWGGHSERIGSGAGAFRVGETAFAGATPEILSTLGAVLDEHMARPAVPTPAPTAPPAHIPPTPTTSAQTNGRHPASVYPAPVPHSEIPLDEIPADIPFPIHAVRDPATVDLDASAVRPVKPKVEVDAVDLCAFVPGIRAMRARCPFAEEVQLGVDEQGVLHLLGRVETPAGAQRAVSTLVAAAAWASLNRRVLELTVQGVALDTRQPGVLHLFTDQPSEARRLLDSEIRVHLLTPTPPDASPWVCSQLN